MNFLFYMTAAVAILSTVMVITRLNAIHALLYFVVSLLSSAFIFLLLGAPFVAALEVIVYAGAIMVLFVFVVMMLNVGQKSIDEERRWFHPAMFLGPAFLALVLMVELVWVMVNTTPTFLAPSTIEPKEVGAVLFGPYVLAVEVASFLLLAGLVGAYHLGRRPKPGEEVVT